MDSSNFLNAKSVSLDYVRKVQAKLDPKTYDKFIQTLKQFRHRNIHSSIAVVTITNLFRDHHPELLLEFERNFVPDKYTAAAGAAAADEADSVDFLNRVEARLKLGRSTDDVYRKFLGLMEAYSKGEMAAVSDVRDRVVELFKKHRHHDLAVEFVSSFLPESYKNVAVVETPPPKKRQKSIIDDKKKITKKDYYKVEDELNYVEVQIYNLESTCDHAVTLARGLCSGSLLPADVRLEEHLTSFSLRWLKTVCKEIGVDDTDVDIICRAIPQLIKHMVKKIEDLRNSREGFFSKLKDMKDYLDRFPPDVS